MKLKSFNYLAGLLIIFLNSPLLSEDKIDIWKNKERKKVLNSENFKIPSVPNIMKNQS